jgi:hypothetical protein
LNYATFLGESLEVLHAWKGPRWNHLQPEPLVMFARAYTPDEMRELLRALAERCPARGEDGAGTCELTLRIGSAEDYELIVLGTHSPTGQSHLMVGEVAKRLIEQNMPIDERRLAPPAPRPPKRLPKTHQMMPRVVESIVKPR